VVFAVIGLLVGGAYGVVRHPSYTAQARIVVGTNISLVNEAASAGLPAAEQAFAAEYARLITTQAVEVATAKALKVSSLPGSLSATPIADSNIIDVNASASSSAAAVAVASAGAVALVTEVNALNTANASTVSTLLSDYNNVQIQINNLTVQQDIVRGKISYLQGLSSLSAVQQGQLAALNKQAASIQAQISTAELQATALSNQYQSQYSPDQADADTVKVSSPGSATGSDRKTFLEIGVLGGLVGGAVVGLALAVAADVRAPARPGGRGGAPEPVAAA
jgi:uncharacterized protein involved in exopolysaccharide biosynthesis